MARVFITDGRIDDFFKHCDVVELYQIADFALHAIENAFVQQFAFTANFVFGCLNDVENGAYVVRNIGLIAFELMIDRRLIAVFGNLRRID